MEERKRNYQIKTYQKNNISRSKKNDRNNKICRSDKKEYPYHQQRKLSYVQNGNTKPEIVAQPVNEMKAPIQEIRTIIRAVTENKPPAKKDTNIEITTNKEKQTKNKENPNAPITEVDSITRPPKGTLQRTSHLTNRHSPKLGKNRSR